MLSSVALTPCVCLVGKTVMVNCGRAAPQPSNTALQIISLSFTCVVKFFLVLCQSLLAVPDTLHLLYLVCLLTINGIESGLRDGHMCGLAHLLNLIISGMTVTVTMTAGELLAADV